MHKPEVRKECETLLAAVYAQQTLLFSIKQNTTFDRMDNNILRFVSIHIAGDPFPTSFPHPIHLENYQKKALSNHIPPALQISRDCKTLSYRELLIHHRTHNHWLKSKTLKFKIGYLD